MAKATKLHELLAVCPSLKTQADKTSNDLKVTFEKKRSLFVEKKQVFKPLAEGAPEVVEEDQKVQTTVRQELAWISGILGKAIDVSYRIAEGNMLARADVILDDGTVLLENAPATALLELDKSAAKVHDIVSQIPTLEPGKNFVPDPSHEKSGMYRGRTETRTRTAKVQKPLVLAPATDKHAAQVQLISVDEPTGSIETQEWSGLITPSCKAAMLERAEKLQRAIKGALARANGVDVPVTGTVGDVMLKFVFGE